MEMEKDMEKWTKAWQHGQRHRNMDKEMETWTRKWNMDQTMETWTKTWKHGRGHGNMDEDMETWTRTWKHGRGYGNMDEDMETWTSTMEPWTRTWKHGDMEIWRNGDMRTCSHGHAAMDMETGIHGDMETKHGHGDMDGSHGHGDRELKYWGILKFYEKDSNGKRKVHRLSVCDKETNGLNGLAHLCIYVYLYISRKEWWGIILH
jgi:hypothetical protein